MLCKVCGEKIDPSMNFCTSCGEKVEGNNNYQYNDDKFNTQKYNHNYNMSHKDYAGKFKTGFNRFVHYFITILKNPIMDINEINQYLSKEITLIFAALLSVIYGVIQCFNVQIMSKTLFSNVTGLFSEIMGGYLYDLNPYMYHMELPYFKIFMHGVIFILINIILLCIITMLACNIFFKKQVSIIDILKIILGSLVILNIITLINIIAMAINIKLLIIVSITGALIYLGTLMFNLANFLGKCSKNIYIIPTIISLTLIINFYIFVSLIS